MGPVTIGIDIGQVRDYTAIVVAERQDSVLERGRWVLPQPRGHMDILNGSDIAWEPAKVEQVYFTHRIERLTLGTPYPKVGDRIVEVAQNIREKTGYKGLLDINIDATGVGLPVADIINVALKKLPNIHVTSVLFTHGHKFERIRSDRATLGKAFLVSRLQVLLQTERIKFPSKNADALALAEELKVYEIKVTADGDDKFGAFSTGTHDDLTTALGLATLPPRKTGAWGFNYMEWIK